MTRHDARVDLLVVGGGAAGLAAAAHAAELGLDVLVAEKGSRTGGSAALSAGIVWTAPDLETFRRVCPAGDPELGRIVVEGYDPAVERIRAAGVAVSERWTDHLGWGVGCHVDPQELFAAFEATIAAGGGTVALETAVRSLVLDDAGAVAGAELDGPEGRLRVEAGAVLLATGGFQGDPELVQQCIGFDADHRVRLRTNPHSVGDGVRLARQAGGALSRGLGLFYGHLVPDRVDVWDDRWFLPLTQYHSAHSIVVNVQGRRFADESLGDEVTNQATLRQPGARAVLICDERVRRERAVGSAYPHGAVVDRFAAAASAGARLHSADTIDALVDGVAAWGVDATGLRRTLRDYEAAARGEAVALDAPLPARPALLREPPFHALAVQPSMTFTLGGVRADADGRVLDRDGRPVAGLYAVGADVGGVQGPGYVGGIVLGLVFGPRAAEAVHRAVAQRAAAV